MAEFDESKHPRDEEGKFTYKGSGQQRTEGEKRREAVRKYSDDPGRDMAEMGYKRIPVASSFHNVKTPHHRGHVKELGYKNEKEYVKGAIQFFNSSKGDLFYSEVRDRYYRYDPSSRLLAICDNEGIIRTFYRTIKNKEFEKMRIQEKLKPI